MVGDSGVHDGESPVETKVRFERSDLLKVAGFVLALIGLILGAVVPLSMYVFQTRSQAISEHAEMKQEAALEKLRREMGSRDLEEVKKDAKDTKEILRTLDSNQRTLMHDLGIRRGRIKPLPASVNFDDLDVTE